MIKKDREQKHKVGEIENSSYFSHDICKYYLMILILKCLINIIHELTCYVYLLLDKYLNHFLKIKLTLNYSFDIFNAN